MSPLFGGGGIGASSVVPEGRSVLAGTVNFTIPGCEPDGASAVNTLTVDEIRYFPWYVATDITIDRLVVEVTTGAANALIRLGLYRADLGWNPTTLVVDGGTVDASTTGVKTVTVATTLTAGRYLACYNSGHAPAVRGIRGGNRFMGSVAALGSSNYVTNWTAVQTFAAFPASPTAPTTGTGFSSTFLQSIWARVATA